MWILLISLSLAGRVKYNNRGLCNHSDLNDPQRFFYSDSYADQNECRAECDAFATCIGFSHANETSTVENSRCRLYFEGVSEKTAGSTEEHNYNTFPHDCFVKDQAKINPENALVMPSQSPSYPLGSCWWTDEFEGWFQGGQILEEISLNSVEDCQAACCANQLCDGYTLRDPNKHSHCMLKTGTYLAAILPEANHLSRRLTGRKTSALPTQSPTSCPTTEPTFSPTSAPSSEPSEFPTMHPTVKPSTSMPTTHPLSSCPSDFPTLNPSVHPSRSPSISPTPHPSTSSPTFSMPTVHPSQPPTSNPSVHPSFSPTTTPTVHPTGTPSSTPSVVPTEFPSAAPSYFPSKTPTMTPSQCPISSSPSATPSFSPSSFPTEHVQLRASAKASGTQIAILVFLGIIVIVILVGSAVGFWGNPFLKGMNINEDIAVDDYMAISDEPGEPYPMDV